MVTGNDKKTYNIVLEILKDEIMNKKDLAELQQVN